MSNPENSPPGHDSPAVRALREEIARYHAQRDELIDKIANAERALSQLLSHTGESFHQLIDMAKVRLLRLGEQSYDQIREHIRTKGGVVIKGDLDHRLRQSLSRAVAAGTIIMRMRGEEPAYDLSKKEKERLRKLHPGK
jgi:hypothetical protein